MVGSVAVIQKAAVQQRRAARHRGRPVGVRDRVPRAGGVRRSSSRSACRPRSRYGRQPSRRSHRDLARGQQNEVTGRVRFRRSPPRGPAAEPARVGAHPDGPPRRRAQGRARRILRGRAAASLPTSCTTASPSAKRSAPAPPASARSRSRGSRGRRRDHHLRYRSFGDWPSARVTIGVDAATNQEDNDASKCRTSSKVYRTELLETHALRDFSLDVEPGEFVAVTGPSGSGKTTFLNVTGLLETFDTGSYLLDGDDVSRLDRRRALARPQSQDRLHLPELQPDPGPRRARQRRRAAALSAHGGRRAQAADRRCARAGRPRLAQPPLPGAALGRPAAARRDCARARRRPGAACSRTSRPATSTR